MKSRYELLVFVIALAGNCLVLHTKRFKKPWFRIEGGGANRSERVYTLLQGWGSQVNPLGS